jgi:hypothetical protein
MPGESRQEAVSSHTGGAKPDFTRSVNHARAAPVCVRWELEHSNTEKARRP